MHLEEVCFGSKTKLWLCKSSHPIDQRLCEHIIWSVMRVKEAFFVQTFQLFFSRMNHSQIQFLCPSRSYRQPVTVSVRECNHPANQPLTKETFEFKKGLDYMAFYLYLTS